MLAILPDPPSKLWMHSKLIKWVTAFWRGQSQLVLVNCIPSNWQTINGTFFFSGGWLWNWWLMTWYYAFQAGGTCHLQPESMNLSKSWVSPSAYHKILHMSVFIHSVIYSKRYLPMYFPQYIGVCISCVYIHIHYVYTCVYIWYIQIHIKDRRREKRDDEYK